MVRQILYPYTLEKSGVIRMSEKRVVRRSIAVTLGIICIISLASLLGTTAAYWSMMNEKDKEISSLRNEKANMQNNLTGLNDIVALAKSEQWFTNDTLTIMPNSDFTILHPINYAGYISVQIESSTTNRTYVQAYYNSHELNYSNRVTVGLGETVFFPVLPSQDLEIIFGRTHSEEQANITVTVVYHY
jgi:hypothetical protein